MIQLTSLIDQQSVPNSQSQERGPELLEGNRDFCMYVNKYLNNDCKRLKAVNEDFMHQKPFFSCIYCIWQELIISTKLAEGT